MPVVSEGLLSQQVRQLIIKTLLQSPVGVNALQLLNNGSLSSVIILSSEPSPVRLSVCLASVINRDTSDYAYLCSLSEIAPYAERTSSGAHSSSGPCSHSSEPSSEEFCIRAIDVSRDMENLLTVFSRQTESTPHACEVLTCLPLFTTAIQPDTYSLHTVHLVGFPHTVLDFLSADDNMIVDKNFRFESLTRLSHGQLLYSEIDKIVKQFPRGFKVDFDGIALTHSSEPYMTSSDIMICLKSQLSFSSFITNPFGTAMFPRECCLLRYSPETTRSQVIFEAIRGSDSDILDRFLKDNVIGQLVWIQKSDLSGGQSATINDVLECLSDVSVSTSEEDTHFDTDDGNDDDACNEKTSTSVNSDIAAHGCIETLTETLHRSFEVAEEVLEVKQRGQQRHRALKDAPYEIQAVAQLLREKETMTSNQNQLWSIVFSEVFFHTKILVHCGAYLYILAI